MKSSIKIDFAGLDNSVNGFEPVIRVEIIHSDDVRDKLLSQFFENLNQCSNWLETDPSDIGQPIGNDQGCRKWTIKPIGQTDLERVNKDIKHRIEYMKSSIGKTEDVITISDIDPTELDVNEEGFGYVFVSSKSLKGLREGVLKEAIENIINSPENYVNF